jgi:hypothetical protein
MLTTYPSSLPNSNSVEEMNISFSELQPETQAFNPMDSQEYLLPETQNDDQQSEPSGLKMRTRTRSIIPTVIPQDNLIPLESEQDKEKDVLLTPDVIPIPDIPIDQQKNPEGSYHSQSQSQSQPSSQSQSRTKRNQKIDLSRSARKQVKKQNLVSEKEEEEEEEAPPQKRRYHLVTKHSVTQTAKVNHRLVRSWNQGTVQQPIYVDYGSWIRILHCS